MEWYESLMAFFFVMTLILAPTTVLLKKRSGKGSKEVEELKKKVEMLESRLTDQEIDNRKMQHDVEFLTRLIEQKK